MTPPDVRAFPHCVLRAFLLVLLCSLSVSARADGQEGEAAAAKTPAANAPVRLDDPYFLDQISDPRQRRQCGPISLALAARRLGVEARSHEIRSWVRLTGEGSSMADLARATEKLGLEATAYELTSTKPLTQLEDGVSAIVLLHSGHFALAWGAGDGRDIWLAEYPKELRRIRHEALLEDEWDPRVLVIAQPGSPSPFRTEPLRFPLYLGGALIVGGVVLALPKRRSVRRTSQ